MKHRGLFWSLVLLSGTMAQSEHSSTHAPAPRMAPAPAHRSVGGGDRSLMSHPHSSAKCGRCSAATGAGAEKVFRSARVQAPPKVTGIGGSGGSGLDPKGNPVTLPHVKTGNEGWVRGNAAKAPKSTEGSYRTGKLGQIPVGGKPIGDPIPARYDHEKDKDQDRDKDRDKDRDNRFREGRHGDGDDRRHDDDDRHRRFHFEERNINFHGREFVHRTYWEHGEERHHYYQRYEYRGVALNVYAPHYYYHPAFYGWAYGAWSAPVAWEWGWAANPWYAFYAGWFRPYPVYSSPSLWLTDYLISQTLEAGYEARVEAAAAKRAALAAEQSTVPMTAEVKQAIAQEVRRQIALENAEAAAGNGAAPDPASSGVARMLNDHVAHIFVVSTPIEVASNEGQCGLSEGDVINLSGPVAANAVSANLVVVAGKGSDCRNGSLVAVGLSDLQDMHNHMRETIDQGLAQLQSKQGAGGIPPAPAAATRPAVEAQFAAIPEPTMSQQ